MKLTSKFINRSGAVLGTVMALQASVAHADNGFNNSSQIQIQGDPNFSGSGNARNEFINLANSALNIILLVVGVLAVFYLIYSGFLYITSAGNPDNVKKARAGIINSIVGIVIVVAAFIIVKFAVGLGNSVATQ